ncbi:MAG: hypothetical protein ABJN36_11600 [Cyclobacteriaceae bacterium]
MGDSREIRRVVFFSKHDISSGYNLQNAEQVLSSTDLSNVSDINDFLELYNIKLYFDNGMFLPDWSDKTRSDFQLTSREAWKKVVQEFNSIDDQNILSKFAALEHSYQKSFWEVFVNLTTYKKISKPYLAQILDQNPYQIRIILTHQKLVSNFANEIRIFLKSFPETAELLLSNYEQAHSSDVPTYYFPNNLSIQDKHDIISNYMDGDNPNLNFIRLIENSTSQELKLTSKIKFNSKKIADELNDKILKEGHSSKFGIQVAMTEDQIEPITRSSEDNIITINYSLEFLDSLKENTDLFRVFDNLFFYTNDHGLFTLVNKPSEMDVMEKLFVKSKNEYIIGMVFQRKHYLSHLQIVSFHHYLIRRNNSLENLVSSFIEDIVGHFGIDTLHLNFPSPNSSYVEKIRSLAPEFEFLLKQFQFYVQEGEIDIELLKYSSSALRLSEIPSMNEKKYIYANDDQINNLQYHFFSDQNTTYYIEPFKDKYKNLFDLLNKENIKLEMFKDYQRGTIDYLINEGYLFIDVNRRIKFKNEPLMIVAKELYENEVMSYWHYQQAIRDQVDLMLNSELLIAKSTLFTDQERDYLNFHLNKKFSNGLDLRNKYAHGTNPSSVKENEQEYLILLKMIVLSLLKIEDDFAIHKTIKN